MSHQRWLNHTHLSSSVWWAMPIAALLQSSSKALLGVRQHPRIGRPSERSHCGYQDALSSVKRRGARDRECGRALGSTCSSRNKQLCDECSRPQGNSPVRRQKKRDVRRRPRLSVRAGRRSGRPEQCYSIGGALIASLPIVTITKSSRRLRYSNPRCDRCRQDAPHRS